MRPRFTRIAIRAGANSLTDVRRGITNSPTLHSKPCFTQRSPYSIVNDAMEKETFPEKVESNENFAGYCPQAHVITREAIQFNGISPLNISCKVSIGLRIELLVTL